MTKLEKAVLILESILVVLFVGLFLAVTFDYLTFDEIRYFIIILIIVFRAEALNGGETIDIKYIKRNDLISLLYKPIEKIKTITTGELEIILQS